MVINKRVQTLVLSLVVVVGLTTCNSDHSTSSTDSESHTEGPTTSGQPNNPVAPAPTTLQANDELFTWVDKLNVREAPGAQSKVISTVQNNEPLVYTGEQSNQKVTIVLRGVAYDEPWLKVTTKDQTSGWVFGGAVKRKGEIKGNAIMDDEHFDFPYFGNFDLTTWQKLPSKNESGGDAEIEVMAYKKGNQILEITRSDVGEYGYSRSYKLMDANRKLLKLRDLKFNVDPELVIVETVSDYATDPAKQYTRSQKLKLHYMRLNAKPEMARGQWETSTMENSGD